MLKYPWSVIVTAALMAAPTVVVPASEALAPIIPVVYEIPRLYDITVDGRGGDWGAASARKIELLIPLQAGLDAVVRIGWDEKGLLMLARVRDDHWLEAADPTSLWKGDAIEVFLAPAPGAADLCQWLIGPGMAPDRPEPQWHLNDVRKTAALRAAPATPDVARTRLDDETCILEARFPWAALGIKPENKRELGFQLWIDDIDVPLGQGTWPRSAPFYPGLGTNRDSTKMHRLRLTDALDEPDRRRAQIVDACISGAHARQVCMQLEQKKGDARAFSAQGVDLGTLQAAGRAYGKLLATDVDQIAQWIKGGESSFKPETDLEPLLNLGLDLAETLPVVVAAEYFATQTPSPAGRLRAKALAGLVQLPLDVSQSDTLLDRQMRLLHGIGLLTAPTDLGIPDHDNALEAVALSCAVQCSEVPFGTKPKDWPPARAWTIALRRVQNFALHHRGAARDYAAELLQQDDLRALLPRIRAMPTTHLVVLGHSDILPDEWGSPAKLQEIVAAVFEKECPGKVTVTSIGKYAASVCWIPEWMPKALASKPDGVLIVACYWDENSDVAALRKITQQCKQAGVRTVTFDHWHYELDDHKQGLIQRLHALKREEGMDLIETLAVLKAHPTRAAFVSNDGIHAGAPYHKVIAAELVKYLVNTFVPTPD